MTERASQRPQLWKLKWHKEYTVDTLVTPTDFPGNLVCRGGFQAAVEIEVENGHVGSGRGRGR